MSEVQSLKSELVHQTELTLERERQLKEKDLEIERLKQELEQSQQQPQISEEEARVIKEHKNAENYLSELIDEFKNGMKRIYDRQIEFKDLDDTKLTFCERFSNLLYNILLIIDYQK